MNVVVTVAINDSACALCVNLLSLSPFVDLCIAIITGRTRFEEFEARKAGEEWEPNPYKSFEVTLNFFRGTMTRLVEHCDPVPQDSPCSSSRHSSEGGGSLPRSCAQATPNASITEKHAEDEHKIIRQESMMKEFGERNLPEAKRRRPAGRNESIWSCPEFRAQAFWLAGGVSEKLQ